MDERFEYNQYEVTPIFGHMDRSREPRRKCVEQWFGLAKLFSSYVVQHATSYMNRVEPSAKVARNITLEDVWFGLAELFLSSMTYHTMAKHSNNPNYHPS